jgi:hypothetical protein
VQEELVERLDYELSRLPDKYRVPVILCELEGLSRKEVARTLGLPEGTLSWRLAQAKKLLGRRLSRQGVSLSVGALAAAVSAGAASAGLSPALRASTVEAVLKAGTVPAQVLVLTEGVMKAMLLTKLKVTACFAALMLLAGVGATGLTYRATAQDSTQGAGYLAPVSSRPQADDLESLRLEMEALRKSLQATRERVKTLEDEVRTLKGQGGMKGGSMMGMGKGMPGMMGRGMGGPPGMRGAGQEMRSGPQGGNVRPSDPVADAEAALKKLRQDPTDKRAADELERALKRLKEREKPRPPAEDNSGAKR